MNNQEKITHLEEKVKELEKSLVAREKICRVLMSRVERSIDSTGGAYSIFERNILLQNIVDERTRELEDANRKLSIEIDERIKSEQRLFSVIQGSPIPTFVIGKDHKVIYWNKALEELSRISRAEIVGTSQHWRAFYRQERPCMADILVDAAVHDINYWYENKWIKSTLIEEAYEATNFFPDLGTKGKWLHFTAASIRNTRGELVGAIETLEDITARKRIEESSRRLAERLRRAEKMEALGTLAGGVAHDLNNILGVLVGYSELLLMAIPDDNPLRKYVSNILQSSEKSAAIIQDLLTLARRGVATSDVVNINKVISDYSNSIEFEKLKMNYPLVSFKINPDNNLMNIKGSPVHLSKTVMNLTANAAEAISGDGEVIIATKNQYLDRPITGYDEIHEGDYVVLTISDTGRGIAVDDIGKIFEPFYTKKKMGRSGTGLGLAVVWGTVKDHEGYIDVQSEEGRGTVFALYFPVTRDEISVNGKTASLESYMGKGESILVIDDVYEQRELAKAMLKKLGYRVACASSGTEAIAYLKTNKADLIVLDMIMDPGIDGLETYQQVLEIEPAQKAIIVSGYSETDKVKKARSLGVGAYVQKPYILEKLGIAVRNELDKR
ncbi:MAG: Blue-light-activated protein [Smithella sp. PtaU1.Bin162]|nr:MAG: Blue-light-activated protein [Smithella sp. PtaU1.Bin162]